PQLSFPPLRFGEGGRGEGLNPLGFRAEETPVSGSGSRKLLYFMVIWLLVLGVAAWIWTRVNPPPPEVREVPFILWGGDVATFHANGGLETRPGSIFDKLGIRVKLKRGDKFEQEQVKPYLANQSPFLRGTMSMLAQVSEQVSRSPESRPVVFLQLTWS